MVFAVIVAVLLLIFAPGYVFLCVPLGLGWHILKSVCKEQTLKDTTESQKDFFGDEDEDIINWELDDIEQDSRDR